MFLDCNDDHLPSFWICLTFSFVFLCCFIMLFFFHLSFTVALFWILWNENAMEWIVSRQNFYIINQKWLSWLVCFAPSTNSNFLLLSSSNFLFLFLREFDLLVSPNPDQVYVFFPSPKMIQFFSQAYQTQAQLNTVAFFACQACQASSFTRPFHIPLDCE